MLEENNTPDENTNTEATTEVSSSNGRRKFLRKAAIGTPVIIATSARPAWATSDVSGNMSGNLSNQSNGITKSEGKASYYWKENYIGAKDEHYEYKNKNKNKKVLKAQYKKYEDQYCVDMQGQVYISRYKQSSSFGGSLRLKDMLNSYDKFEQEVGAAFINTSLQDELRYPYNENEIKEFCKDVQKGRYTRKQVADALEKVNGYS